MRLLEKENLIQNGIITASKKHITGSFTEHGHKFFEIEYVISGSGTYIIDGISYPICKNTLFFMSPSNFHAVKDCDAEIINIMFSCNLCDTNSVYCLSSFENLCALNLSDEDSILIEKMLMEITKSNDINYMVHFLRAVTLKLSNMVENKKGVPQSTQSHIQSAIIYTLENFRSSITLKSTAEHTKLAPAYLSTLFLKETGTNFKAYLDEIRFDYATKLLKFTQLSVSEVCTTSGFTDYTNFTRRFKAKFNCTPSEYRKEKKKR